MDIVCRARVYDTLIFVSYRFVQVVLKLEEEEVSSCTQKVWAGAAIDFIQNQTNCKLLFLTSRQSLHYFLAVSDSLSFRLFQ